MILVTGANGQLGRRIVQHLIAREPSLLDGRLGVSVRDPAQATELASRGVIVRKADFDQPDAMATAFAGVRRLVLVSTDGPGAERSARHRRAINAALSAGVSHILYTSLLGADADRPTEPAAAHRETESALQHCGVAHTVLRNPLYADDLRYLADTRMDAFQTPLARAQIAAPAMRRRCNDEEADGHGRHVPRARKTRSLSFNRHLLGCEPPPWRGDGADGGAG